LTRLIVIVALPLLVGLWWWDAEQPRQVAAARLAQPASDPLVLPAAPRGRLLGGLEDYAVILERPLFTASRRSREPARAETALLSVAEPTLRLVGIVRQYGLAWGIITVDGNGEFRRVRPGDEIAGWEVLSVASDHLVARRDQELRELRLQP
jgi:hypothetical protein